MDVQVTRRCGRSLESMQYPLGIRHTSSMDFLMASVPPTADCGAAFAFVLDAYMMFYFFPMCRRHAENLFDSQPCEHYLIHVPVTVSCRLLYRNGVIKFTTSSPALSASIINRELCVGAGMTALRTRNDIRSGRSWSMFYGWAG